jgi:DMSO/TMAO reductase YedYZ molybdopterin-dependent catalytic subunit
VDRRAFLRGFGQAAALAGALRIPPAFADSLPVGAVESATLEALPGKQPLIKRTYRPPNYETPVAAFGDILTPADRFFVRWHVADIPEIDAGQWRLSIGGDAAQSPLEVSLAELQRDFERVEVVAVCQCSGNRRGFSDPHVPGVQWGYGAMGNARWTGVRLRDVLARAGVAANAVEVSFAGQDRGQLDATPAFIKSIPAWKAMDENTLIAWAMNGEPLPHWNGAPARIVVPGWTATYWMKQVTQIRVLSQPFGGFWMAKAYRLPRGKFATVDRFITQETAENTPITEIVVNSLVTSAVDGARVRAGSPMEVKGIAWDAGFGIRSVDVSVDAGRSWRAADFGTDMGRFSFRPWRFAFTPGKGAHVISARATNALGATQTDRLIFNPAGYNNNVVQRIRIEAA